MRYFVTVSFTLPKAQLGVQSAQLATSGSIVRNRNFVACWQQLPSLTRPKLVRFHYDADQLAILRELWHGSTRFVLSHLETELNYAHHLGRDSHFPWLE
jgi:hypothetical protein